MEFRGEKYFLSDVSSPYGSDIYDLNAYKLRELRGTQGDIGDMKYLIKLQSETVRPIK